MSKKPKNKILKDLLWYLAGSTLPLLVGFFRVPIFTRYFTTEEYGVYGLILITYTILSIFLFNWLSNCIWRFYNKYKKTRELNGFYSNLFLLYIFFSIIFFIVTITWNLAASGEVVRKLIYLIFFQLLLNSANNYFLIVLRLEEESAKYNIITSLRAGLAFAIQYYLTFRMGYRIEAIPISMIIVELIILLYLLPHFLKQNKLSFKLVSWKTIKVFLEYSIPGILSNLGLYILTSSDRYIIALFGNVSEVGIYNQVYNLCQVSIMAVISLFFAIINPGFMRELEMNFEATRRITLLYIKNYLLFILPVIVYTAIFSYWVAYILLGEDFRIGYTMIPWIVIAIFFYGLTLFPENRLKFKENYRIIIIGFLSCSALNIILNILLIPKFGYTWAAITTLISYFFLMILFFRFDIKNNSFFISGYKELLPAIIILSIQVMAYYLIRNYFDIELTLKASIITGVVFALTYTVVVIGFSRKTIKMLVRFYNK